jgi:hypothetical protein
MKNIIKNNYTRIISLPLLLLVSLQSYGFDLNKDPFSSIEGLGPDLKGSSDGATTIAIWILGIIWYVAAIIDFMLIIGTVYCFVHALTMSREQKEHSKPSTLIVFGIICLCLGLVVSSLLFSTIGNTSS